MTDEQVRQSLIEILNRDSRVDEREIGLRVANGVVYLSGAVDSAAERRAVLEDVESCYCVLSVIDGLVLKNYVARPDVELSQSVRRHLLRHPDLDVSRIEIQAQDGRILLEGSVKTYAEKNAVENAAWWFSGVVHVISHLSVDERDLVED